MFDSTQTTNFQERFKVFESCRAEFEARAAQNDGMLPRHDIWRLRYYRRPYLIRASNEYIWRRYCDIFSNMSEINEHGKISIHPAMKNESKLGEKWTHLLEEWNSRGGLPSRMIEEGRERVFRYYRNGAPRGVALFNGIVNTRDNLLVKFSAKPHLLKMYHEGEFRISAASSYLSYNDNEAIRDNEIEREYFIPTYREVIEGRKIISHQGKKVNVSDGDFFYRHRLQDYYLFSTCMDTDRRLPDDFKADGALVIHDAKLFEQKLTEAVSLALDGWKTTVGPVTYIDPYCDYEVIPFLEMTKHFHYQYQKEHRFVWYCEFDLPKNLQPIYVKIGSMKNYAELAML